MVVQWAHVFGLLVGLVLVLALQTYGAEWAAAEEHSGGEYGNASASPAWKTHNVFLLHAEGVIVTQYAVLLFGLASVVFWL